jgi:hypothetical protein
VNLEEQYASLIQDFGDVAKGIQLIVVRLKGTPVGIHSPALVKDSIDKARYVLTDIEETIDENYAFAMQGGRIEEHREINRKDKRPSRKIRA